MDEKAGKEAAQIQFDPHTFYVGMWLMHFRGPLRAKPERYAPRNQHQEGVVTAVGWRSPDDDDQWHVKGRLRMIKIHDEDKVRQFSDDIEEDIYDEAIEKVLRKGTGYIGKILKTSPVKEIIDSGFQKLLCNGGEIADKLETDDIEREPWFQPVVAEDE